MKISLCSLGEETNEQWIDRLRLAEILGFHGYYHADEKWTRDCYVRLAIGAQATTKLTLGVEVADPYSRHPAFLAQMMATIAELAPDRTVLMMSSGSHFEYLPGWEIVKPVAGIREAIDLCRRLWAGERVTMEGKVIQFRNGQLNFLPKSQPEVWIASRGPQILGLAGEVADAVLIGSFATPAGIEWAKGHIKVGLDRAGRTFDDIRLVSWLYTYVKDSPDEPDPENFRRGLSHAFWSSRDALMNRIDELAPDVTDEFKEFVRTAPHEWSPEVMAELRRVLPRGLFDSMAVIGTADEVVAKLQALEAAGIDEAILWPFTRDEGQDVEDVMAKLADRVLPRVGARPEREKYNLQD